MMWALAAGCILGAYLIGAIPFGLLIGRLKGVDIRLHGSGNIGATNAGRVLGRQYGLLVFALDLLKGFLPVLAAGALLPTRPADPQQSAGLMAWVMVAAGAIVGHMFPVYLGFKGGKGVATSLGALLGIYPYFTFPGLAVFGLWIVVTALTRYVSVGSVTAAGAFPIMFALWSGRGAYADGWSLWPLHVFALVVAVMIIYRHRGNLQRLLAGTEHRIGRPRAGQSPSWQGDPPVGAADDEGGRT